MFWESMLKKFGGTSRPARKCDFVVFSLNRYYRFKLWWSDYIGIGADAYRLHFQVWIDSEGVTIGRFILFRNSCIRLDFANGIWTLDENGIQMESTDGNSRLILTDQRLAKAISKIDAFRSVVRMGRTQTSSLHWEPVQV